MADCIRGFNVPCILCGKEDGNVMICAADVTDFHCIECSESFGVDDVETVVRNWRAVLDWIATCPDRES